MTDEEKEETKRTVSTPHSFVAKVDELMKDMEKKTPRVLTHHDGGDGNGGRDEFKEELEDTD